MTRQGQSEDAPAAVAPLDLHGGIGECLGLSHESSTSHQSMNVCIHSRGGVLLYDYSCEDVCRGGEDAGAGCGSNAQGQMRPSLQFLSPSPRHIILSA